MKPLVRLSLSAFVVALATVQTLFASDPLVWPSPTKEQRPWTRWWWLGSAVDKANLTHQLEQFAAAGLGGVEVCPIYGVKGQAERNIDFLSPQWMEMLAHATKEAKRLGLGFDMTTGTGWPFGGPDVAGEIASSGLVLKRYEVAGGQRLEAALPPGRIDSVMAFPSEGQGIELKDRVRDGRLDWTAPTGQWRLYVASVKERVQKVKRPAPGGAGYVLDPYSTNAMARYLDKFDRAFVGWEGVMPRAQFHDSFEYYGATWTPEFFAEFQKRRGYDLRQHLPALNGDGAADVVGRVKSDYRETISDLHLDYMRAWGRWAHAKGSLVRNQAHGAPANLVDLYAASDVPETEIFGSLEEGSVPMNKFSTSAAHLAGRKLASSESFTWLDEHFNATLAEVKHAADYLFLCGVNHIFFHGIPYSPQDAPWPGWQFYASVNFGPQGGLWHDLPAFNGYVARVQSVLQSGKPDNDVLLYFPAHDIWSSTNGLLMTFTVHNVSTWLGKNPAYDLALRLWDEGYGYDYVSDAFLAKATVENGRIGIGGASYRAVVVPRVAVMRAETLRRLGDLARAGAKVVFQDALPDAPPGLGSLKQREAAFALEKAAIKSAGNTTTADLDGAGLASALGFTGEAMAKDGLRFVRRNVAGETIYFVVNQGDAAFDGWLPLRAAGNSVAVLDPLARRESGWAAVRKEGSFLAARLRMEPGESLVLRVGNRSLKAPAWEVRELAGSSREIPGPWRVSFQLGDQVPPRSFVADTLESWTLRPDPQATSFAGTARYSTEFAGPAADEKIGGWMLDLGRVADSARVSINGRDLAPLWCPPFRIDVSRWLKPGTNRIEIDVTSVAANHVRDLDVRKVDWKYFEDANVVGKNYKPLDASLWPVRDAGLLGPVRLRALDAAE